MSKSPLFQKLQAIADDFSCGVWGSPVVLSPQLYTEKVDAEFASEPNPITAVRRARGQGAWALVFQRPAGPNSRGGPPSKGPLEAIVTFSPEEVKHRDPDEIRKDMIGVIAVREFHEVLEWAQCPSTPNVPIIDPHTQSGDLLDVVGRVTTALVDHAAV